MRDWIIGIESRGELYERLLEADPNEEDGDGDGDDGDMANGNEENAEDMMLIAVHEVVDEVPYVGENFAAAQIAQSSTLLHLERNQIVKKQKKSMLTVLQA